MNQGTLKILNILVTDNDLVSISLIKLGCRERSPGATVGPRDFVDGSIQRARNGNSWKLIGIGKFANRCHGDPKNLHFCTKSTYPAIAAISSAISQPILTKFGMINLLGVESVMAEPDFENTDWLPW